MLGPCPGDALWARTAPPVLTANYDSARTSSNLAESLLNPGNVAPATFGKLVELPVDGQVYAQPLYVPGVNIRNGGTHNVLFVATMHNSVFAFDAEPDGPRDPLWKVTLGTPVPAANYSVYAFFTDIAPEVGVLSTPVIDAAAGVMYVVSANISADRYEYRLHALDIASGDEVQGPVAMSAAVAGSGDDSTAGAVVFDPYWHIQRPALTLADGVVYVGFGSHGDSGVYHGWILGYSAADITRQISVFNASPDGAGSSLWMSGRGFAVDGSGALYAVTANGDFDGIRNFGETALKLDGKHGLSVLDWFTPFNFSALNEADDDLGSCGAVLIPGTPFMVAAGKQGVVYLLDTTHMGNLSPQDAGIPQSFPAGGGSIFNMALWNRADGPVLYLKSFGYPPAAYRLNGDVFEPVSEGTPEGGGYSYGGIAVTANGNDTNTGIVWLTTSDGGPRGLPWAGTLRAFDANDLTKEIWHSDMDPQDVLPSFAKFVTPTIVAGRVYMPTFSNSVVVYGLKSDGQQALQNIQVTNAFSRAGTAVAPGEMVLVTGTAIGPANSVRYQPGTTGSLPLEMEGVSVLFDGQPAPLVEVSSTEVTVVVPSSVAGKDRTQITLSYGNLTSNGLSLPVATAAPGLAMAGIATQGAILNEDGSQNLPDNPAPAGSVVQVALTGIGATSPDNCGLDETGIRRLAAPQLPVGVLVGGQQADIAYVGGAPGMVGAVAVVRFQIPDTAGAGNAVPVVVVVDGISSQTVTMAVGQTPGVSSINLSR